MWIQLNPSNFKNLLAQFSGPRVVENHGVFFFLRDLRKPNWMAQFGEAELGFPMDSPLERVIGNI